MGTLPLVGKMNRKDHTVFIPYHKAYHGSPRDRLAKTGKIRAGDILKEFTEMGIIGEPQSIGDLLHGQGGVQRVAFRPADDVLLDMVSCRKTRHPLDDLVEIAGCDAETGSIFGYLFARFVVVLDHLQEATHERLISAARDLRLLGTQAVKEIREEEF